MSVLHTKLLRDFYRTKGLMLAIASIIAIGIMTLVTMQSAFLNLTYAKHSYYQQCRMADFWITVKKVPSVEVPQLARVDGVSEIQSRIQFSATVDLENSPQTINGLVVSLPDRRAPILNDIVIRQGDYFTDELANQVIVNEKFAREHNLYPGQTIHLLLNKRRQALTIVGTAISSEFTYLLGPGSIMPDPKQFGVFYVKQTFAEDVFNFQDAANQIVGRFSPNSGLSPLTILQQLESRLDDFGVAASSPLKEQISNQFVMSEIDGLGSMAKILPAVFLVVASLILNVLMTRLSQQQRTVIGTLKALGYSHSQVFFHFLQLGLFVGVLGGIAGASLGYLASFGMTTAYREIYEFPDLRSGFHWPVMLLGILVSILCSVSGSLLGARSALQLQPAAAMRPAAPRSGGRILLERLTWLWSSLTAAWRITLRSVLRNRIRSSVGVFASAMGGGLLVGGLMMMKAQDFLVEFQYDKIARSDIDLVLAKETSIDVLHEIAAFPAVDLVEPRLDVPCTLYHGPYHDKTSITGLRSQPTLTVPYDRMGNPIRIPDHGIVLGKTMAEKLHATLGDSLTMIPSQGDKRPVDVVVSQISDGYFGVSSYANLEFLSRLIGETRVVNSVQLKVNRDLGETAALHLELKRIPGITSVRDQGKIESTLRDLVLQVQAIFITALIGFAGAIFFGSLLNASMINLAERSQEVATLLAIGYGPFQVGAMFLRESLLINLLGSLLGIPAGYGLTWFTAESMKNDLVRLPVLINWNIVVIELGTALAFGLLAHCIVQWRIARLNILDALKVKE
ncbi:ABC transporter permease [Aureliella helgolandensis]|uniref:FtsX-like permease family protein n=1 Tax=Aureliella helgolandensis TaxID=2527968 RepID=A0A518FZL4_9BACT|nr:ABC transporter permease [Aureliella helgolandensis]QDV21730.1 FtsX-like permease family protein [Aureliella helgolandensis]